MTIYKKLSLVQSALLHKDIPKNGHNRHKGFKYHELEDLIPPIFEECTKQELTLVFTFVENAAILKLRDWNGKDEISVRVTMPQLVIPDKNPNNQLIQAVGANVTYLKRYLLVNTFLITEKDIIDASPKETSSNTSTKQVAEKVENCDVNVGQFIIEAENKLKKKGLTSNEITRDAIKKQAISLCSTVEERRAVIKYFKQKEAS